MYILILSVIILICSFTVSREYFKGWFTFPFGLSTRNTRGMTYDMRCLPKIKKRFIPWAYSTMYPNHYGKCLNLN